MRELYKNLIVSIFILILIQSLSPEGKYKKYVVLISYIAVLSSFILPILSFITNREYEDISISTNLISDTYVTDSSSEELVGIMITDTYREKLTQALENELTNAGITAQLDIQINTDTAAEDYGNIEAVYVKTDSSTEENDIKKIIENFYNVNNDNIYIMRE